MKQITLLICILFLVTSCEIQYDGETKIAVTGNLIDDGGNPLANKDIHVTILTDAGLFSAGSDLISYGKSDQKGNFSLIFPDPIGNYSFSIEINKNINQTNEFRYKEFSARKNNFENYKLNLDNITLYKSESITTLKLLLNKTSTNKQLIKIQVEGKLYSDFIDLNPTDNYPNNFQTDYQVIKNQMILLKYTTADVTNNGATTVTSILIPIVNDAVTYTITY